MGRCYGGGAPPNMDHSQESFTTFDWVGVILTGFATLGLLLFPFVGRTFSVMFEDLSDKGALPLLTRLATSAWFPLLLALPGGVGLALCLQRRRPLGHRRACIVGAFVFCGIAIALCIVGVYLPLFKLADAVHAE